MVSMEKEIMQVSEIMTKNPISLGINAKVTEVAKKMRSYNINSVLLLKGKSLVGIVTADDIVRKFVAKSRDPETTLVSDIMSKDIISAEPTICIRDAMAILNDNDIRQLPIVYKNKLVGLVTVKDLLRIEPTLMDLAINHFREEEQTRQDMIQTYVEDDVLYSIPTTEDDDDEDSDEKLLYD